MAINRATISSKVGDDQSIFHDIQLRGNSLLISNYYLQSLLPQSSQLLGVLALVECDSSLTRVPSPPQWDVESHQHFLIDGLLSSSFELLHSASCVHVSESEECNSTYEFKKDSLTKVAVSKRINPHLEFNVVHLDSSTNEKEQAKSHSVVTCIQQNPQAKRLKRLLSICGPPL